MEKKDLTANLKEAQDYLMKEFRINIIDFFNYLRLKYAGKELEKNSGLKPYLERVLKKPVDKVIPVPLLSDEQKHGLESFIAAHDIDWASQTFHLHNRATTADELISIFLHYTDRDAEKVIEQGYKLSVMPVNMAINNKELLNKFFPKADFFEEHAAKKIDPYGIFTKGSKVYKDGVYIGSQKFPESFLMNVTNKCYLGCVGCYKGNYTRIIGKKFFTNLKKAASIQSDKLLEYLNENREIESVIISGGEPLLLKNNGVKKILGKLSKTDYLSELRICTGTIFQGLPMRIDQELLGYLNDFENGTGIQVHFNVHLSHPSQFSPEALIAVKKINDYGFSINTQIPLQKNVNVFVEENKEVSKQKTLDILYELARLQGSAGVRPYKYILHMNSGSLEYSVPLEFMLDILGEFKYRPDHPLPETWQPVSFSILCQEGNILLSPQLLFCMKKSINKKDGFVEYKIPVPENGFKVVEYKEPVIKGYNDDPKSLKSL